MDITSQQVAKALGYRVESQIIRGVLHRNEAPSTQYKLIAPDGTPVPNTHRMKGRFSGLLVNFYADEFEAWTAAPDYLHDLTACEQALAATGHGYVFTSKPLKPNHPRYYACRLYNYDAAVIGLVAATGVSEVSQCHAACAALLAFKQTGLLPAAGIWE